MRIAVAITGASGIVYGTRLIEVLKEKGIEHICLATDAAKKVTALESDGQILPSDCVDEDKIEYSVASGSYKVDAMVIIPCSMKTLSAVANGYSSNLVTRAADVVIKEGRQLIIVPRETPLNAIHLENMLKLSRIGVTILPAMPAFYHKPKSIDDLVDFVVGKVLDSLSIEHNLFRRWE